MEPIDQLVIQAATAPTLDERLKAYGRIVGQFQDMACGYAYAVLGDFHLAEDAAQDAFIIAFGRLGQLRRPEAFPGWLRRIVWSACGRTTRGKRPKGLGLDAAADVPARTPTPPELLERREMIGEVLKAVAALPGPEREVVTLFYINGYSQNEVAEFLELPVTTVKNRLTASRRRLKERMLDMVAQELNQAKPSPNFADRVRQIIAIRRQGTHEEALRLQETALGLLRALARAGRHEEVVRRHTEAMQAIRADGGDPQMWCQTYSLLAWSYRKAGKAGELVRGLSATIPATPTPQEVGLWVGEAALDLVEALVAAGNPPQAVEQGRRLVEWLRRAVAEISPEPWQGEPVPAAASAITKMGEILRTGRMNEHLDGAQRLLEQEQFQEFRQRVLWVIRLPEVILMGLPRDLKTWEIPGALQRMALASHHLAAQSRHEFCSRIAKEMLAVAERLRGHPAYRYLRMGAVLDQLSVAASKADADGMEVVRRQVYAELEAGENELAAACPGVSGEAEAGNDDDRYWCERLSAAYMIAAGHLRQYRLIDAAEALRLTRREAQLHDAWITQEALARWTLGAQGDRRAALEHLRSAVTPETDFEYLQNVFHGCEEYASVRDDPEFLAVIKPPEGGDIGD